MMDRKFVLKPSVFQKNEGFTLLEMLLNLGVAVMIVSLFPLVILNVSHFKAVASDNYDINLELCLRDIISETKKKELSVSNGTLLAEDKQLNKVYSYSFNQSRIVRKVDNLGYIILLEKVKSAKFTASGTSIFLELTWQDRWRTKNEIFQIK